MTFPLLALMTDFGDCDGFTGVLKGVIYQTLQHHAGTATLLATHPPIVDIAHHIAPQDVWGGAWVLENSAPYFPPQTVFVCVVDPGVGSSAQQPMLLHWPEKQQIFLAPNNGLLTPILVAAGKSARCRALENPVYYRDAGQGLSQTFHGRDLYAPLAAHAALAMAEDRLQGFLPTVGPELSDPVQLPQEPAQRTVQGFQATCRGIVRHIDVYGNLLTNLPNDWAPPAGTPVKVEIPSSPEGMATRHAVVFRQAYAEGSSQELLLLPGSHGFLELASNQGSAQRLTQCGVGTRLIFQWMTETAD
jgi:S-adenosylmethionine hydrolase